MYISYNQISTQTFTSIFEKEELARKHGDRVAPLDAARHDYALVIVDDLITNAKRPYVLVSGQWMAKDPQIVVPSVMFFEGEPPKKGAKYVARASFGPDKSHYAHPGEVRCYLWPYREGWPQQGPAPCKTPKWDDPQVLEYQW